MPRRIGRCPDCGEAVPVAVTRGRPAKILPHGCMARHCEYLACHVRRPPDKMIQFPSGAWYCQPHALVATARDLVRLYQTKPVDWAAIAEVLDQMLPAILERSNA